MWDVTALDQVRIRFYVMTSEHTHEDTVKFFEQHQYFNFIKEDVFFFQQGTLPCLTTEGKIIMASPFEVSTAPDGNGGMYRALRDSHALDHMKK
mgnify:CR=1 FL=1